MASLGSAVLMLALVLVSRVQAQTALELLEHGDEVIAGQKAADFQNLVTALRRMDGGDRYVQLLMVRGLCAAHLTTEADGLLLKSFPSAVPLVDMPLDMQLAYAGTLRRMRKFSDALAIADRIGTLSNGPMRPFAAELMSDIHVDMTMTKVGVTVSNP